MPDSTTILPAELSVDDPRWVRFIGDHPGAGIFHHPAWIGTLAACYGYRPSIAALMEGERIAAAIPVMKVHGMLKGRRLVALPFSDHCSPLVRDTSLLDPLIDHLDAMRRRDGASRVEVAWELPERANIHPGRRVLLHTTDLSDGPLRLFERFHRTRVQQPIRSAEREGMMLVRGDSWEEMRTFYRLHLVTRRRLGTPVQPLRFFRILWDRIVARGLGFTLIAYRMGTPVAASLFLRWGETLTYKFNASLREQWSASPNHLIVWEGMKQGIAIGCRRFDWGRTDIDHEGLRDFKRGWAAEEREMTTSVIADAPPAPAADQPGGALARRIIRHSPQWVCRAIGEMLYREMG